MSFIWHSFLFNQIYRDIQISKDRNSYFVSFPVLIFILNGIETVFLQNGLSTECKFSYNIEISEALNSFNFFHYNRLEQALELGFYGFYVTFVQNPQGTNQTHSINEMLVPLFFR